jgi:hypothetical protein
MIPSVFFPGIDDGCDSEFKAKVERVRETIAAYNDEQAKSENQRADRDTMPIEDRIGAVETARKRDAALLARGLKLRRELLELDVAYRAELQKLSRSEEVRTEPARMRVRGALVALGYHSPVDGHPDPGAYAQIWVERHPDVRGSRERLDELRNKGSDHAYPQAIDGEIRLIESRLRELQEKVGTV